jgi:hypothetical protein
VLLGMVTYWLLPSHPLWDAWMLTPQEREMLHLRVSLPALLPALLFTAAQLLLAFQTLCWPAHHQPGPCVLYQQAQRPRGTTG